MYVHMHILHVVYVHIRMYSSCTVYLRICSHFLIPS